MTIQSFHKSRRRFLKTTTLISSGIYTGFSAKDLLAASEQQTLKTGGSFNNPTFIALIETIIPGRNTDPTGAPGALEAGTLQFLEEFNNQGILPVPFNLVQWILCRCLNLVSYMKHFKAFSKLTLTQREPIVEMFTKVKGFPLLLNIIRAPFYTGNINTVGLEYLKYPGPNYGYPDFSFNEQCWKSDVRCKNGNLP